MMNSETSTDVGRGFSPADREQLQPWQLFTLAGLAGATAVVFVTKDAGPAAVVLLSITVGAAAFAALAAWRALAPLAGVHRAETTQVLGGRTRVALEREKTLVLRAIKDLEFDRAMGKVADKDFAEMGARLRARATSLLRELDRGQGYRDEIEREIAKRVGPEAPRSPEGLRHESPAADVRRCASCGLANDRDARFCKNCGTRIDS